MGFLERRFRLTERSTTVRIELLGGAATFLTMSYILFVNPAILSAAGMPFDAVAVATAIAACVATLAMGLFTNLPFALAPGLGINAVVAFDIVLGRGLEWPVAMSIIVIEGLIALVLVIAGLRGAIMRAVPLSLKLSIGVGIGLFITLVGLREGGIVVNNPATGIGLGDLTSGPALIALAGIVVGGRADRARRQGRGDPRRARRDRARADLRRARRPGRRSSRRPARTTSRRSATALDPSNLADALTVALIPVIFALFMTDFFDTIGTAVAVGRGAGLTDEQGQLPNSDRLLLVDSAAASFGGAMGTSSVTTYVESRRRRRRGRPHRALLARRRGRCSALAIFFVPIIALVGQDVKVGEDTFIHPAIAPGARDGRLPDDPDRRRHRLVGPGELDPGVPDDRRHPARRSRSPPASARRHLLRDRDGRLRQGPGDPPADVGDRRRSSWRSSRRTG